MKATGIVFFRFLLSLVIIWSTSSAQNTSVTDTNTDLPAGDDIDPTDDTDIDAPDGSFQALGQRCGRNHPCQEGLDCYPAPIAKRCFPITCAFQSMMAAMDTSAFDLNTYGDDMMTLAGISTNNLRSSNMFRPFPDNQLNAVDTNSSDLQSLLRTLQANPPPLDVIANSFRSCTKASVPGTTPYFGASWGLGFLGTYNGDIYWGQGSADPIQLATLNNCFGAVLGYDLGVSGLVGIAMTGSIAELQEGCKQMFPLASFPPISIEIGFIDCLDPVFLVEMTAGIAASAGLPGYTSCTTTKLDIVGGA